MNLLLIRKKLIYLASYFSDVQGHHPTFGQLPGLDYFPYFIDLFKSVFQLVKSLYFIAIN